MLFNRCKDIHKFGNKYLPSAYKTQVEFRSHFSGKKVRLMVREIRYLEEYLFQCHFVYCKSHVDWSGIDFQCARLVSNCLSYDMITLW